MLQFSCMRCVCVIKYKNEGNMSLCLIRNQEISEQFCPMFVWRGVFAHAREGKMVTNIAHNVRSVFNSPAPTVFAR